MADIEQLSRALLAADKAGDTQSAQLLANEIRKLQGSQQQSTPTQAEAPAQDTNGPMQGFGAAFRSGIDQPLENMAETARAVGADGTAETLSNLTSAPENYESASAKFIEGDEDGSFAYRYLPKAAVEQIGQYAGSLLARAGGLAAGTAVGGPVGGAVGAFAGPFAFEAVQLLGPIANERARNNGRDRPNKDDFIAAAQTAAASGALNALIPGRGGIVKRTAAETATEGAQSVVEQTGSTAGTDVGLQIDPRQAFGEALLGGTAAGGFNVALTTVNSAGDKVFKPKEDLDPETTQAASDVSALLQRVADENGYNLKDIDSSSKKGANQTLEGARDVLLKDLEAQVISLTEKGQIKALSPEDKAFFKQAIRQSKGKVGTTVTKENFDFMQDRFGNTREGQALLNTFRRSNVLTEVYAGGLKGGVSKFTDMFNPLPSIGRAYNPAGMVAGNINTGAALATGGQSLAAQIPLVVGGRAIDAVTGRRSKVNRFVKKNRKGDGLADPTAPAARDLVQEAKDRRAAEVALRNQPDPEVERQKAEKAQQKADGERRKFEEGQKKQFFDEEEAKRNAQQYANGEPPLPNSPRGTVHSAIIETYGPQGRTVAELDAAIMKALDDVLADPNTTAERKRAIRAYKQSLATGKSIMDGSPLNDVTSLIRSKNLNFESKKPKKGQKPIEPQLPIERQLGKNSNQAYLATLRDKMDNDTSILAEDRATLGDAFDSMALNLGKDPVASLEAIVSRATSNLMKPKLAETYLTPYMERVKQQQKAKDVPPVPPAPSPSGPDGPTVAGTVSPSGPVDSGQPTQPALAQQPEPPKVAPLDAEPTKPKKVKKPTAKSVKKAMPEAKAIIEIGRKGSKYENGIQDVDQALEVARLLGITARMMNSGSALQKETRTGRGTAALHRWGPSMKGFGSSVFFVKPGGSIGGNKITSTTSLMNILHEMGHSLTQGNMDGKGEFGMGMVKNPFSGDWDQVGKNSYNTSVMKPILEGLGKDHPAVKEIHAFQEAGKAFTESNPSETTPARDIARILEDLNNAKSPKETAFYKASMNRYRRYTNNTSELSVDPMWLYLMNPRLAKELMPINTKLIRDEFKKANNGKIQFYSHPFATLVAVVSAMGLLAAGSEEDEEPMMAPGILSA
jgi:hypothetical protein